MAGIENTPQRVIIVGSSIAGLRTAEELSKRGFQTTVIAPSQKEVPGFVQSTPFIRRSIAEQMGLSIGGTPEVHDGRAGLRRRGFSPSQLANAGFRVAVGRALKDDALVAIDYHDAQQELLERAQQDANITFIQERFTSVLMENDTVVGIKVGDQGEELRGIVVDATGRSAHVLSQLGEKVSSREVNDPSAIIGAYVSLSEKIYREFPLLKTNEVMIEVLPDGLFVIFLPHKMEGSNATHLLLVEGNSEKINKALQANSQRETNTTRRENVINSRWGAIIELLAGSDWERVVGEVTEVDKVTNYTHKASIARRPEVSGIAAIGDAAGYINPINGAGFRFINRDAKLLGELFSKWSGQISGERILSIFNEIQAFRFNGRLRRAKRIHSIANLAHRNSGR